MNLFLFPYYLKLIPKASSAASIEYFKTIILASLIGSLAAIGIGHMIARNTIKQLHEFTKTLEAISIDNLSTRINPSNWPKELERLGESFNVMLSRIETSFENLQQFSSDVAHELKTPLNNLMLNTEITLSKATSIEDFQKQLSIHMEEYQQLSKMIDNLLFLARAKQNQIKINAEVIQLDKEIDKLVAFYQGYGEEMEVTIKRYGQALGQVDVLLFGRLMNNLLSNAIKYSKKRE
ncbi:histidine kinase dimerization/phospho-acceptor domain-containing protein [Legionella israelensis]|nr:histidine kinase dimerization/phospho-acceptor domain-containing protein [Legionella israelensis]